MALEHLHKQHIIYRDLKPENLLVCQDGYLNVTDFGLSREDVQGKNRAQSFCGTAEYLSPEVIQKSGYGKPSDWWQLGTLIYEMLVGQCPFSSSSTSCSNSLEELQNELYDSIQNKEIDEQKMSHVSEQAQDLIQRLLTKDEHKRLGSDLGAEDIKAHPWFAGIDWEGIYNKTVVPPYVPKLKK